jgi:hypothetical protein
VATGGKSGERFVDIARTLVAAIAAALLLVGLATPAVGGEPPYGGTSTTTTGEGGGVTCDLSASRGSSGQTATATVEGVTVGETVRIVFDGEEVAREVATATTVVIEFTVPERPRGSYEVAAVGDTFTTSCGRTGGRFTIVQGATTERGDAGGGSLPRTGIYVGLLVAVALGLLLLGRALLRARHHREASSSVPRAGV